MNAHTAEEQLIETSKGIATGSSSSAPPYFPALDGLRALSVFMVITAHTHGPAGFTRFLPGWLGVDVFFALSGFLIMTLLIRENRLFGRVDLSAFYIRRAFRILPVYLLLLLIYTLLSYSRGPAVWAEFRRGLPYYLGFLNEYTPIATFSFTWTLGIEEKFYLVWPALCYVFFPRSRRVLTAVLYVLLVALMPVAYQASRSYSGLMLGCALALGLAGIHRARFEGTLQRLPVAVPLALVLLSAFLCYLNVHFVLLFSPAILLLIAHLVTRSTWLSTALSGAFMVWVGRRSYSMYLVHGLVLGALEGHLPTGTVAQHLVVGIAATAGAALLAHILFLTVEEPFRKLGKRLIARRKRTRAALV